MLLYNEKSPNEQLTENRAGDRAGAVGWGGGDGSGAEGGGKVGSFYNIFVSCFLIDMKFISKLLEFVYGEINVRRFLVSHFSCAQNIRIFKFQIFKSSKNRKSISCFLIDMKFISKLLKKFLRQNQCQEIPHLSLFMFFKNLSFPIIKNTGILNFKKSKSGHLRFPKFRNS